MSLASAATAQNWRMIYIALTTSSALYARQLLGEVWCAAPCTVRPPSQSSLPIRSIPYRRSVAHPGPQARLPRPVLIERQ